MNNSQATPVAPVANSPLPPQTVPGSVAPDMVVPSLGQQPQAPGPKPVSGQQVARSLPSVGPGPNQAPGPQPAATIPPTAPPQAQPPTTLPNPRAPNSQPQMNPYRPPVATPGLPLPPAAIAPKTAPPIASVTGLPQAPQPNPIPVPPTADPVWANGVIPTNTQIAHPTRPRLFSDMRLPMLISLILTTALVVGIIVAAVLIWTN